jgi:hypothetical protein
MTKLRGFIILEVDCDSVRELLCAPCPNPCPVLPERFIVPGPPWCRCTGNNGVIFCDNSAGKMLFHTVRNRRLISILATLAWLAASSAFHCATGARYSGLPQRNAPRLYDLIRMRSSTDHFQWPMAKSISQIPAEKLLSCSLPKIRTVAMIAVIQVQSGDRYA